MLFGFNSVGEWFGSVYKHIDTAFIKYFVPVFALVDLVFQFLFESTGAIYFLIIMYCIDFVTGVAKSTYFLVLYKKTGSPEYKDKRLTSKKFPRFALTMFAGLMVLSMVKFMGVYTFIFQPLYSIFYPVFLGQQFISVAENLGEMKLIPWSIVEKLKQKVNSKINSDVQQNQ